MIIKIIGLFLLTVLAFTIGYVVGRCADDHGQSDEFNEVTWVDID